MTASFFHQLLLKIFKPKKLTLKIHSAVSTVVHGKRLKYVSFPGFRLWQHIILRGFNEHCIAAEIIGYRKTFPISKIQGISVVSYHFLQTLQKTISDQLL